MKIEMSMVGSLLTWIAAAFFVIRGCDAMKSTPKLPSRHSFADLRAVKPLALGLSLLVSLVSGSALAQTPNKKIAVFGIGPNGSPLLNAPASATPVWVDTVVKTLIQGWTEYDPTTCTDISTGSLTVLTNPTHGMLFFGIENHTLANGDCPGIMFPFAVARYTWTDSKQPVLQDPFTLDWTTPDGMFNQINSFTAELAKITQAKSVWWVCGFTGGILPQTAILTLNNPPSGAMSFVWTITAGASDLVFSNGTATITTTTPTAGIKSLAASTAMSNVSMNVVVQKLTYSFKTTVRTPRQLKSRPDLSSDSGRGANCMVSGTQGYLSDIAYEVDDQFGVNTAKPNNDNAGVNELLKAKTNKQPNNWSEGLEGASPTSGGLFADSVCVRNKATHTPNPTPPQNPLSTDLVDEIPQTWFAGSSRKPPPNQGCKVQTDTIDRYIDHARDRNIKSPPALRADFAAETSLAVGETDYPIPVQNVRYLEEQSSAIVKGSVLEVNEVGTIKKRAKDGLLTFHEMTASVQVDTILKGKVESKVINVDFLENPDVPALSLEQNEYVLLFLTNGENGGYTFADPQVGKMPITSQSVPAAETGQTTAGKLEAELFASISDPDPEVARTALQQVGNLGSVRSTLAIRDIATSGAHDFQGSAYIALLKLCDYSLLTESIRFVEQPGQDSDVQRVQFGVAEAIGDITDGTVLPTLNSLLSSPTLSLRRAGAKALRQISDPSSARALALALEDSDREVQYDAVMGLAELVGASADNAPAREIFDKNPGKYLNIWKTWWESSGK